MVETARVELASESASTRLSPSAADGLVFALPAVHQQTAGSAISLVPYDTENSRKVFLYKSMPDSLPTGKQRLTRGAELSS